MGTKKNTENENIHAGHRQRVFQKFDKAGFDGWQDHEILEMMLYQFRVRGNMNEVAHRLINFSGGSINAVLRDACDGNKLTEVKGVGEETVRLLRSIKYFFDHCRLEALREGPMVFNRDNIHDIISIAGLNEAREKLIMLCLDELMCIKNIIDLTGSSNTTKASVDPDRLVRSAVNAHAANVIIMHNHPSGSESISKEDREFTHNADTMLGMFNVRLVDHFVIAGDKIISIRMSEMNNDKKNNRTGLARTNKKRSH